MEIRNLVKWCPDLFGQTLYMLEANHRTQSFLFYKIWVISMKKAKWWNYENLNILSFIWNSVSKLWSVNTYYLTEFVSRELFFHVAKRHAAVPEDLLPSLWFFSPKWFIHYTCTSPEEEITFLFSWILMVYFLVQKRLLSLTVNIDRVGLILRI